MRADLSLYRVFVAVADEGSFVRAAAKLYLTQPAVSQAVRRMEAQTGAKLFLRGRRGVRLTREGELLYRHASAALAMLEAGEQQLPCVQNLEAGTPASGRGRHHHQGISASVSQRVPHAAPGRAAAGDKPHLGAAGAESAGRQAGHGGGEPANRR